MLRHKLAATLAAVALASPAVAWAEDEPLPVQIVDAMNKAFGTHPGFRANHAKGVVVEGSFKASPEALALSKAKLFDGSTIPATVRFSDFDRRTEPAGRFGACQSAWHGDQVSSAERRGSRHGDQLA